MKTIKWNKETKASNILNQILENWINDPNINEDNLGSLAFATGRVECMEENR